MIIQKNLEGNIEWQHCKDIPSVNNNGNIVDFNGTNLLIHLILKQK